MLTDHPHQYNYMHVDSSVVVSDLYDLDTGCYKEFQSGKQVESLESLMLGKIPKNCGLDISFHKEHLIFADEIEKNHYHEWNLKFRVRRKVQSLAVSDSNLHPISAFQAEDTTNSNLLCSYDLQKADKLLESTITSFKKNSLIPGQKEGITQRDLFSIDTRNSLEFKNQREKSLEKYLNSIKRNCSFNQALHDIFYDDTMNMNHLGDREFKDLITRNKVSAAAIQFYFYWNKIPRNFEKKLASVSTDLMMDKYGCHILRRLILKSDLIKKEVILKTIDTFVQASTNEYSSRVMQMLVAVHPNYTIKCIELFCEQWDEIYSKVPAIYLINACMKNSVPQSTGILAICSTLKQKLRYKNEKSYKKILSCYIENLNSVQTQEDAPIQAIGEFQFYFKQYDFNRSFYEKCQDKYTVIVFLALLKRRYEPAEHILAKLLNADIRYHLSSSHFHLIMLEVMKGEDFNSRLRVEVLYWSIEVTKSYGAHSKDLTSYPSFKKNYEHNDHWKTRESNQYKRNNRAFLPPFSRKYFKKVQNEYDQPDSTRESKRPMDSIQAATLSLKELLETHEIRFYN